MITGEDFVLAVKDACFWPSGVDRAPLPDASILRLADRERRGELSHVIKKISPSFDRVYKDYTPEGARYRLPDRMHGAVEQVTWIDASGKEWQIHPITHVETLDSQASASRCNECRHYLDGDRLVLWPTPSSTEGTLRVYYRLAPSRLVKSTSELVGVLASAVWNNAGNGLLTIGIDTSSGYAPAAGDTIDIVSIGNAHSVLVLDGELTDALLGLFTLDTGSDPGVVAGDYACTPGYTPIAPIPDVLEPAFIRHVAAACLEAHGDRQGAAVERDAAMRLARQAIADIKPRDHSSPGSVSTLNSAFGGGRWNGNYWPSR